MIKQISIAAVVSFFAFSNYPALAYKSEPEPTDTTRAGKTILRSRAVLPAATFAQGPSSGSLLGQGPINGQTVPFINKQPVQGFSAVSKNNDGTYMVMCDNGFGAIENSSDFNLRVYTIKPNFKTQKGGKGEIEVLKFFELSDPDKHIPFAITNHFTKKRILTGADFDIESMQKTKDGTFWFGDEFGPFLLHTDASGKLLEAPIALPDFENPGKEIRSPQNPFNEESSAVRIMNAVKTHAKIYGNQKTPVFSPWFSLLNDGNPSSGSPDRLTPPQGLSAASSDIFSVTSLKNAGFPVVAWTINDKTNIEGTIKLGVNGIISDRPDLLWQVVSTYDGNNDGKADFIGSDGLIDINLFDAQGHRGGRSLRPENTLPAMEAGLDNLMTTLETDAGITKDGIAILDHDPHIEAVKVRRADGKPYTYDNQVLIKDYTLKEIQSTFIADKLLSDRPIQSNDRNLSPVAVAFAKANGLMDPYVMPSVQQLFDFVKFYIDYYKTGPGSSHSSAEKRWKNAAKVRFNIETKINPRTDKDDKGDVFAERTLGPEIFAKKLAEVIVKNKHEDKADIQSFDFRTLLLVQKNYPAIRTVYLFGDFPKVGNVSDGTNLQDQDGANTPWLGGLYWPYRSSAVSTPFRSKQSGGFEGMAYDKKNNRLLPLLEQPLVGDNSKTLLIHEFNLSSKSYTGVKYKYTLDVRGTNIGDFVMFDSKRGLIIERDGSQGDLNGFKAVYEIELKGNTKVVGKALAANLMNISDPDEISLPGKPGDVGLGKEFAFPFTTIEDVVVLDEKHIGVLNDNNYPFSVGRHVGQMISDDNEFIILGLEKALGKTKIEGSQGLTLINADNGSEITELKKIQTFRLSELPSQNLSIRADFDKDEVKSVVFDFNGQTRFRIENTEPYALFGDNNKGKYYRFTFRPGVDYHIVATPYSLPDGKGTAGKSLKVSFRIEIGAVKSFVLIDADDDREVMQIENGSVIDLAQLPSKNINILANTDTTDIGSVVFEWDNGDWYRIENTAPFSLVGDGNFGENYYGFTPKLGFHKLTATSFLKDDGNGASALPYTVHFLVIDSSFDWEKFFEELQCFPNPIDDILNIKIPYCLETVFDLAILDQNGNEIYSEEIDLKTLNPERILQFDLSFLEKGIFYIRIAGPTMENKTFRFVKN